MSRRGSKLAALVLLSANSPDVAAAAVRQVTALRNACQQLLPRGASPLLLLLLLLLILLGLLR